jgi:PAS domain S-box-containing protein
MIQDSPANIRFARIAYQVRTAAFAASCITIGLHMSGREYGTVAWILLVLQFLVYPHVLFWRARAARNSRQAERTNMMFDALLLGIWAAALEFPIWIAFTLFMACALNNAVNGGVRGALGALLAYAGGALSWALVGGFHYSPQTTLPVTALCMIGLAAYVTGVGAISFVQNRKLRRAQRALVRSEEQFRTLAEQLPLGLALIGSDGKYEFVNSQFTQLTGYDTTDVPTGLTWFAKAFPDETYRREIIVAWKDDLLPITQGVPRPREYSVTCKDGSQKIVLFRPVTLSDGRQCVMYEDITDRRRAEDALRQSEMLLRTTVEASPIVLFTLDTQGIFQISTGAGLKRLGLRPGEVVGQSVFELYKDAPQVLDCITRALRGEVITHAVEVEGVIWDTHYAPILNEKNEVQGVVGAAADVSDLKRAEAAIRALNEDLERRVVIRTEQLARANKEMESFAYSISHDLRAPLRALCGFSEILLRDYSQRLNDEASQLIGRIAQNAQRMGDMVDDLLRLSQVGSGDLDQRAVDVNAVVNEVIAAHSGEYPRTQVATSPLPGAHCDRGLVRQVFENLIGNAFKYSSKVAAPRVEVGVETRGERIVFFVRDNGAGFDMQYAGKLFGVFQRLHKDSEFPGTGVGLVIVKRIIERHGGRIWASAKPDQGATFYFTLN